MALPASIHDQVERLSEQGNVQFDRQAYAAAIRPWIEALDLLPEPRVDWDAWTWLNTSIGDAYYQLGNHAQARRALLDALNGPGAHDNPFIHYRLGQAALQGGAEPQAVEHLLKAYMLDGTTIFEAEPDGQRYLDVLRRKGLVR
jgi:tetratricopeptide (TPR) repeat protein